MVTLGISDYLDFVHHHVWKDRDLFNEIGSLRHDLQLSGYPQGFTDSVNNSKGKSRLNKQQKPLASV
jgi:hypothetical protein